MEHNLMYETPIMEITDFEMTDVVATSGETLINGGDDGDIGGSSDYGDGW